MANPFSSACKTTGAAKMKAIGGSCGGMAKGGGVHHTKKSYGHSGGHSGDMKAMGKKGGGRLDKPRRDKGGVHKRTKLNISAMAPPPPDPNMTPNPMPPPGMSAGPMPQPGMMKHGGYIKRARGGRIKRDAGGVVPNIPVKSDAPNTGSNAGSGGGGGGSALKDIATMVSPAYMAYRAISGKKLGGRIPKAGMDSGTGRLQLTKLQRGKNSH